MELNKIYHGDTLEVLKTFPNESIDMVITSPPYYALRDYGIEGQIGLESTFQEYLNKLINIFDEVKRILKPTGSCWVNLGDSYGGTGDKNQYVDPKNPEGRNGQVKSLTKGLQGKCLLQIPNRFAIMMTDHGWILRNEIIWHKPNCMPASVTDRFTVDFEKLFFFVKNKEYYFEQQKVPNKEVSIRARNAKLNQTTDEGASKNAVNVQLGTENRGYRFIPEDGRNMRCVWEITTQPFKGSHFAVFPEKLIEIPIKACCPPEIGSVLDIFMGSGTTGVVAKKLGRNYVGIDINPKYIAMAEKRIKRTYRQFALF